SIDYYEVDIDGVIGFVGAQAVADYCFEEGVQRYCNNLNYDGNGVLQTIDLFYENLTSMHAKGVDLEASYSFSLYDLVDLPGDVTLRFMATNFMENSTNDGTRVIDDAGAN